MRAFIYARFSCKNQKEISIEGQVRECHEYAEKHGIDVMAVYSDRARSGRTENRADFRRLMRDVEAHAVDCVLVWKFDRFFRDRAESALYRRQLEACGVHLISVTEYIPEGSAGVITQGMIETVAEYFSAKLSEDVSRGMHETAMRCRVTGSIPLGYKAGPDKSYQVDPAGADTVRLAFRLFDAGERLADIAARFNQEGRRTSVGSLFKVNSFDTILRNEKYIGVYRYSSDVCIPDGVPRLVPDDLFFRVQRKLAANKHRPGSYKADVDYYLSGKIFCGHCGASMAGISGTSRNGARHYYYSCANHRLRRGCSKRNVPKDAVEDVVLRAALAILNPETVAYIAAEVEKASIAHSESSALLASLNGQLDDVQRTIKNIGRAISAGIITETTKELLEAAEADRAALRVQIERAKVQAALTIHAERVACWLDSFRGGDLKDPAFRRDVFGALVHSVYVYDDHLRIVFNVDKHGAAVVPFALVDSAAPAGSYLSGSGAPKKLSSERMGAFFFGGSLHKTQGILHPPAETHHPLYRFLKLRIRALLQ